MEVRAKRLHPDFIACWYERDAGMAKAPDIRTVMLKVLGIILPGAGSLKGRQLLAGPAVVTHFQTFPPFLILQNSCCRLRLTRPGLSGSSPEPPRNHPPPISKPSSQKPRNLK